MLRAILLLILLLLHHHVAVTEVTEDVTIKEFCRATPKGIILEADGLTVRKPYLFEHAVAIPFIGIVTCLPSNMRATFLRYLVVRMLCQSTTWSLQDEVTLNVIEIVIMAVTTAEDIVSIIITLNLCVHQANYYITLYPN